MLRRLSLATAVVLGTLAALGSATASATSVSATLTSSNGYGSFDDTIGCASGGDGPSWRYAYSGVSSSASALAGLWSGTIEVHSGGGANGFVPPGTGRVRIEGTRGNIDFEFDHGDCAFPPLLITGLPFDPVASGYLLLTVTGGTGSFRGLTGSGSISTTSELGAGGSNNATWAMTGNFGAKQPALSIGNIKASYNGLGNFLSKKATVSFAIPNAATAGDAFDVKVASVAPSCSCPVSGTPQSVGNIAAGSASGATVQITGLNPNTNYTITVTLQGKDALDTAITPVVATGSFKTPGLPSV